MHIAQIHKQNGLFQEIKDINYIDVDGKIVFASAKVSKKECYNTTCNFQNKLLNICSDKILCNCKYRKSNPFVADMEKLMKDIDNEFAKYIKKTGDIKVSALLTKIIAKVLTKFPDILPEPLKTPELCPTCEGKGRNHIKINNFEYNDNKCPTCGGAKVITR